MCCFTGVVQWVGATKIFARPSAEGRQFLVYSMSVETKDELAMVLPLPVPKDTPENAVKFINLEAYPEFFADMARGWPVPQSRGRAGGVAAATPKAAPPLKVEKVGSFEASFVPTVADFSRLDQRFRLPDGVWEKLPGYKNHGFAVFKLQPALAPAATPAADPFAEPAPAKLAPRKQNIHPMAFEFPRANRKQIFFPTVHIHDGEVHDKADFDHELYFQFAAADVSPARGWTESAVPAGMFMQIKKAQGLLDGELHCYRRQIRGEQKNADTIV